MKHTKTRATWRGLVGGAAVALLAFGGAQAANAADNVIDPDQTGSLTVHKHQQSSPASETEGTGLEQSLDTDQYPPIGNIEFSLQQLDVDLTTNQGWQDLADLNETFSPNLNVADTPWGLPVTGDVETDRTANDGALTFGDLEPGAYLVWESDWQNPVDANGEAVDGGITPSFPFIVTVPMTNPDDLNAWVYDVHVYPKNAVTPPPTKTVEDSDAVKIGDNIEYTITSEIPDGTEIDGYRVRDTFDAKLAYVSSTVELSDGTALVEGTDYTVNQDGQTVDIDFTAAGLDVLEQHSDAQVVVTHTATVLEVGEITNEPQLFPNNPAIENDTPTDGPGVETKFGNIVIQKHDENDEALAGAKFSVYLTEEDARNNTNAIEIDGQSVFESGEDGIALIEGLRYSCFEDGAELAEEDCRSYWVAEVEAPAGYELLANPIEVSVDSTDAEVPTETVVNVPKNAGFELPITGGAGTSALLIGGLLLMGGAIVVLARRRKTSTAA